MSNRKNQGNVATVILLLTTMVMAITAVAISLRVQKIQQPVSLPKPKATNDVTIWCNGTSEGQTIVGDLLYHQFTNADECNAVANDPERSRQLVGAMAACGSSAICLKTGSCTTVRRTRGRGEDQEESFDCSITTSIPPCSVAQYDCNQQNGWGGSVVSNCSGCGVIHTPTPTPTPTTTPPNTPTPTPPNTPTPTRTPTPTPTGTPRPTPTPTPTPTGTQTPTPTPTPRQGCNANCTGDTNCLSGLVCSGGFCRNPSCTQQTSCSCQLPTPTPEVPVSGAGPSVLGATVIGAGALLLLLGLVL